MRSPFCPRRPPSSPPADASAPSPSSRKHRPPRTPKENVDPSPSPAAVGKKHLAARNRSPLPPRPPIRRKLNPDESAPDSSGCGASDSGVQVVVRIRPPTREEEQEEPIVSKSAPNGVTILGQEFTFDCVADAGASQEDIFQLVGVPLVENCIAGFNSSIFAYGQTGSGKTYTMWGPSSSLADHSAASVDQGLAPRVFEQLFRRIKEEQEKHAGKQLTYYCRCSFLEIYNEQISDLLEPLQRNLLIREDVKTGVFVDSLTEVEVSAMKDVTQLLNKGLANRKTGATTVNAESSRSHCVFTCVIESRSKSIEDGLNTFNIRRINLVDLAGSERQKTTNAAGDRLKEAGTINRSLLQLGNLINILAEVSQSGKPRHIPYRDSRLTFLLQESLGGNAKLSMICAVSPCQGSETLSTLRFAQRARAIKNKAVVNEIRQNNVNLLREQIHELKEELQRLKSHGASFGGPGTFSTGNSARRSLRLLRMSLGCQPTLPSIKDDSDEEMEIDENDVEKLPTVAPQTATEKNPASVDVKHAMDVNTCSVQSELMSAKQLTSVPAQLCAGTDLVGASAKEKGRSSLNLAASIHRGLQIIRRHQEKANSRRKSLSFVDKALETSIALPACKADVGVQTDSREHPICGNEALRECEGCLEDLQSALAPIDSQLMSNIKDHPFLKGAEKVLAGAIRREMTLKEHCRNQSAEIQQLNLMAQHYKHERKCNALIAQIREEKIERLESLLDGILSKDEFVKEEYLMLMEEHMLLQRKYDHHPEVLRLNIEMKRLQAELDSYKNFFDLDEKEVLLEEIQDLRDQLQHYMRFYSMSSRKSAASSGKSNPPPQLTWAADPGSQHIGTHSGGQDASAEMLDWTRTENGWMTLTEELRRNLEANRCSAERLRVELAMEKKCSDELKDALETAIQGHARILEQYADLQEKHMTLLATNRRISDGIEDVKRAAAAAGVNDPELRFISALAEEISVLRAEREKEQNYWRDENRALQAQLRDTAEAVQAAGELLVRLKEAQEAASLAQKRALTAEKEKEAACQEIDSLKKNYEVLQQHAVARLPNEARQQDPSPALVSGIGDGGGYENRSPQPWLEEHEGFGRRGALGEVSKSTDPTSWFSEYDRCNI